MQKLNPMQNYRWNQINWRPLQLKLFKWQRQIYKASKLGDIRKVRRLQHLLIGSSCAKLIAVRRVTQDNKGKKTAGIDNVKSLTPVQRLALAKILKFPMEASPLRRVWIPKPGKSEKRPLGIPTIKDRCLQALLKLAIEPEWEAKFEPNSYGFRPGRKCHDAVNAIKNAVQKRAKYVLDADIAKCFDRINHDALLEKIGLKGKYRTQIKYWLKCGVLDAGVFQKTELGTPQGGVISPLLANIALHGMETAVKNCFPDIPVYWSSGVKVRPNRAPETLHIIRYADDFVILHDDLAVILRCREAIVEFLKGAGLELSAAKTRLTHTLQLNPATDLPQLGFDGKVGFNFLGFTIKQFKTRHKSAKNTLGEKLGFKTLIYPSKNSISKHQEELHELILAQGKALNQVALIKKLNAIIRGWSQYFGVSDASTMGILQKQDFLLYLKLRRWALRIKGTAGKAAKYWNRIGTNKWVFSNPEKTSVLLKHIQYARAIGSAEGYVKVRESYSPFDENQKYWSARLGTNPLFTARVTQLLKRQKGACNWCKLNFLESDVWEADHIIPRHQKGPDTLANLQLLHVHCHDVKTKRDNEFAKSEVP